MILFPRLSKHPFLSENIYNWSRIDEVEVQKKTPLYQSKYKPAVKEFYKALRSPIPRTMGYPQTPGKNPKDYLKKRSSENKIIKETKSASCLCRELTPHRQNAKDIEVDKSSVLMRQPQRNFVVENSFHVQRRPATAPEQRLVDDRKGNAFDVENSGCVPKYIKKEEYGEKPKYLEEIDRNLEESRKKFRDFLYAENMMKRPEKMKAETKEKIFEGVVKNWKELLRRYLCLPLETETPLQLERKLEIERRIDSLEKDIELLVRHKDIFIGKGYSIES